MTRSWPIGSTRRARAARDSGMKIAARVIAATPIGTLIQKIERQPIVSVSRPPSTGPTPRLMPTTPPHTPIARARSFGSVKTLVMIDIATGLSIEPPTACTARNAISQPRLGATLHSNDPTREEHESGLERPPATESVGGRTGQDQQTGDGRPCSASTTHCSPESDACRSTRIDGRATFTIVLSMPTISRLMQQMARISIRRPRVISSTPKSNQLYVHNYRGLQRSCRSGREEHHVLRVDPVPGRP